MPLAHVTTTETVPEVVRPVLLQKLSRAVAEGIGKPETYVMVIVQDRASMLHAGSDGPAAFVEVRSIGGLGGGVRRALSERICGVLEDQIKVPGDRVYLNFADVPASSWGHNGSTFG
jgi:phenylpyruvate tautomerase